MTTTNSSIARELIEHFELRFALTEDAARPGKLIVRGEFARAGVPTQNRRIYPRRLWENNFRRLAEGIQNRSVFGELNHPTDGKANMFCVSHLITGLALDENGIVIGEAEVLEGTPGGDIVANIYRRGGKIGVSSRGFGSTAPNAEGVDVVQEDYNLVTFDFVADPADQYAYPEMVNESLERAEDMTPDQIAKMRADAKAEALAEAKKLVESQLAQKLPALRAQAMTEARAEVAKTAPASAELSALRAEVAQSKLQVEAANAQLAKATKLARITGFNLFIERSLRDDPDAEAICAAIGDLAQYENAAALKTKLAEAREATTASRQAAALRERTEQQVESARSAEVTALELRVSKLQEGLEKVLEINKELALKLHTEQRIAHHPEAPRLRRVVESAHPRDMNELDDLLEDVSRAPQRSQVQVESARGRARAAVSRFARTTTPLDEEAPQGEVERGDNDYNGLGVSMRELRGLSGIN